MFIKAHEAECRDGMVRVETALIQRQRAENICNAESAQFATGTGPALDRYQSDQRRESANTTAVQPLARAAPHALDDVAPAVAGLTG